jgi:hypothetical protein
MNKSPADDEQSSGMFTKEQCEMFQHVVLNAFPEKFRRIFLNVSEPRAIGALKDVCSISSDAAAREVLSTLVERGLLSTSSISGCSRPPDKVVLYFKPFYRQDFPSDLARSRHVLTRGNVSHQFHPWESDLLYAEYFLHAPPLTNHAYRTLLFEWGFGRHCPHPPFVRFIRTGCIRSLMVDSDKIDMMLAGRNSIEYDDAEVHEECMHAEHVDDDELERDDTQDDDVSASDDNLLDTSECETSITTSCTMSWLAQLPPHSSSSSCSCDYTHRTSAVTNEEQSLARSELASLEQLLGRETARRVFVRVAPMIACAHAAPCAVVPPITAEKPLASATSARWATRSAMRASPCCGVGLRLLGEIDDERMLPNMTHGDQASQVTEDGGCRRDMAFLRSYLRRNVPLPNLFLLYDNLSTLRLTAEAVKERWHTQRLSEDCCSFGRMFHIELWELRYPGWLIADVLHNLGKSLLTIELQTLLEEIVVARFPALKHVPDTIRADVLVSFGRVEPMDKLLAFMERLVPVYFRKGGRTTATKTATIRPQFVTPAECLRPVTEWTREQWLPMRDRFIAARDGAPRRILEAAGYWPLHAPW